MSLQKSFAQNGRRPMYRSYVYRNLHANCWSVRRRGKVVDRPRRICLKDCRFLVGKKGREKVLKEKRKNVHAGVSGFTLPEIPCHLNGPESGMWGWKQVFYNPYERGYFFDSDGNQVKESRYAWFNFNLQAAQVWIVT